MPAATPESPPRRSEPGRARPAADRDLDPQVRVRGLQLEQLVEVAEHVLVRIRRIVGDAVDALGPAPRRRLVVGPLVAEDAAGRGRKRERVLDLVDLAGRNLVDEVGTAMRGTSCPSLRLVLIASAG